MVCCLRFHRVGGSRDVRGFYVHHGELVVGEILLIEGVDDLHRGNRRVAGILLHRREQASQKPGALSASKDVLEDEVRGEGNGRM
ncbi:hypothetical protein SAMN05920897_1229 [Alkalispirochaeta americana]|uniref:Uncharacterized protein n=1 Tax=Alkalispirochaeta americana TaxID=159291 RepID=A0A1N6XBB8_9SPIO|nr:hypothetical protein SAMN05920897_1229 [Alkalispirochaeta americana]